MMLVVVDCSTFSVMPRQRKVPCCTDTARILNSFCYHSRMTGSVSVRLDPASTLSTDHMRSQLCIAHVLYRVGIAAILVQTPTVAALESNDHDGIALHDAVETTTCECGKNRAQQIPWTM
jgi:hypothetical protein